MTRDLIKREREREREENERLEISKTSNRKFDNLR